MTHARREARQTEMEKSHATETYPWWARPPRRRLHRRRQAAALHIHLPEPSWATTPSYRNRSIGRQFRRGPPPPPVAWRSLAACTKQAMEEGRWERREEGQCGEGGAKQLSRRENVVASRKERWLQMVRAFARSSLYHYISCISPSVFRHARTSFGGTHRG
jgi:hypothetical protein